MSEYIADVYRSNLIESRHKGDIAIVDPDGTLTHFFGNPENQTYLRSAAKPFQILPVINSGAADFFNFTKQEIAVMSASHNGEEKHVNTVRNILKKIDVSEEKLNCGIHDPYFKKAAHKLYLEGNKPTEIHNNCSGKHAALLSLCKFNGWDIENYLNKEHPVQQLILTTISEVTETKKENIYLGEDGCGVVVFGLSVKKMAYGFARLANPKFLPNEYREAALRINKSIKDHPDMIAGTKRFNTDLIDVMGDKLTGKMGAEGVFCFGLYNGPGVSLKVEDGNSRAVPPVIIDILKSLNYISKQELKKLKRHEQPVVKNHHDHEVGYIKSILKLKKEVNI
ncbi:MAG TPA: asparaginase [Halanaerobiales bacterium]|nr:asparaginase [Halanaerobiales bacterium]